MKYSHLLSFILFFTLPSLVMAISIQVPLDHVEADAIETHQGTVKTTKSTFNLMGSENRWVSLNFTPTLPPGVKIKSAYIQFHAAKSNEEPTQLIIFAEKNDRSATIKEVQVNLPRRPRSIDVLPPLNC